MCKHAMSTCQDPEETNAPLSYRVLRSALPLLAAAVVAVGILAGCRGSTRQDLSGASSQTTASLPPASGLVLHLEDYQGASDNAQSNQNLPVQGTPCTLPVKQILVRDGAGNIIGVADVPSAIFSLVPRDERYTDIDCVTTTSVDVPQSLPVYEIAFDNSPPTLYSQAKLAQSDWDITICVRASVRK